MLNECWRTNTASINTSRWWKSEFFGNTLILDGIIQLTERDNMGYHEMIVHVPMLAVEKPEHVLIVGGGGWRLPAAGAALSVCKRSSGLRIG